MFRLSKKALFAIEAVVDIAYHAGAAPVRSNEISERQGIPRRYLEQVLQQLVHHDVLAGLRGPRGGYRLAKERRKISIGEIIRIVRDLEGGGDPIGETNGSELGRKVVRPIWAEMQQEFMNRLDELTIEDLCNRASQLDISRDTDQPPDFSI